MTQTQQAADPRVADLVQAGRVRVALHVPLYKKDAATGKLSGWPIDLIAALGARIGVEGVPIEHPNPADSLMSVASGACDCGIIGIETERATKIDYSPPVVEADYTLLARAGFPYQSIADADRQGVRIAAVRNHASTIALNKIIKYATFVYADMPEPAFQILQRGDAGLFASLHEVLRHYMARLPGSRIWDGRYGFNALGFSVPKGRAGRLAFLTEFAEEAKASGVAQRAINHSGWTGIRVAPRAT
jgi:polar amino acid transport system substrate-binding protein